MTPRHRILSALRCVWRRLWGLPPRAASLAVREKNARAALARYLAQQPPISEETATTAGTNNMLVGGAVTTDTKEVTP